jgi:DNA-binding response OmpR family regulator
MKRGKNSQAGVAGSSAKAALQCRTNPPQRILVVEDEPDMRQLDAEVLRQSGFKVDTADNGLAALQALEIEHYDLLIVEDEMALVTGLELVRKLHLDQQMVPVILVLGAVPTALLGRNPWPQIQAILVKPYTVAELFKTVDEVLGAAGSGVCLRSAPPSNSQKPDIKGCVSDPTLRKVNP